MTILLASAAAAGCLWLLVLGFETTLLAFVVVVPLLAWFQIHIPGVPWSLVPSALLAVLAYQAIRLRPAPGPARPAFGLTAVVLVYLAVVAAQTFSPGLPSVVIGIRGLRLIAEPMLLYFIGTEVARRPQLRRRMMVVILFTGVIVIGYGLKQWIGGFDRAERIYYRHTFPIAIRERRISSTLFGATALGDYVALVIFVTMARLVARGRATAGSLALIAAAILVVFLTGQRGVQISVLVAVGAAVSIAFLRPDARRPAARLGQVLFVVVVVAIAIAITTPTQDRRKASAAGQSALDAARIKLALLKEGSAESSFQLRNERMTEVGHALATAPFGVGTGLNLLLDRNRSDHSTVLGAAGFGGPDYQPRLPPVPGELYYYNLASELGLPGLVLWSALALFGIVTAGGVALRHPDREKAAFALVAMAYLLLIVIDSFTVDAMTTIQVSAWFWLLLGAVGRWGQEDRVPADGRSHRSSVTAGCA